MKSLRANQLEHLRKRSEFVAMVHGKRIHTSSFVLQVRKRDTHSGDGKGNDNMRVGYTVTKRTGNAVVRNRIKRRLREVAQQSLPQKGAYGHDYVLIGKRAALNAQFSSLISDMKNALKKLSRAPSNKFIQAGNQNGQ